MTLSLQPPTQPGDARNPDDDLDGLLRDYFRAETPNPWPVFRFAAVRQAVLPSRPRRFPLTRSHLALAASVALILLGSLFLAGIPRDAQPGEVPTMASPDAKRIKVKEYLNLKPDGSTEFKSEASLEEELPRSKE
jgi:hypothetical protein